MEGFGEILLHQAELADELRFHLSKQLRNQLLQVILGLLQVFLLGVQAGIAFGHLGVFLDGPHIDRTQTANLLPQGTGLTVCFAFLERRFGIGLSQFLRARIAQLVGVPQPVAQLAKVCFDPILSDFLTV